MCRSFVIRIALALFAAAASAASAAAQPGPSATCDVKITFGSNAMGIDQPSFERVQRLMARDQRVAHSEQQRWGREGEVTICAKVHRSKDVIPLFYRIKGLLSKTPRGPLTLEAGGRRYQTRGALSCLPCAPVCGSLHEMGRA